MKRSPGLVAAHYTIARRVAMFHSVQSDVARAEGDAVAARAELEDARRSLAEANGATAAALALLASRQVALDDALALLHA